MPDPQVNPVTKLLVGDPEETLPADAAYLVTVAVPEFESRSTTYRLLLLSSAIATGLTA